MTDTGSTSIGTRSESSSGPLALPSPSSSGSSSPAQLAAVRYATVTSWGLIAIMTAAWWRGMFGDLPRWFPPLLIVMAGIRGDALGGVLKAAALAAIEKLPGKGGK